MTKPTLIVGGGLAGLACATTLAGQNQPFEVFEATDRWGGRVGSSRKDGYVLDTGFQVYLDAYPTAASFLDLEALALKPFCSGALVAREGRFMAMADPFRHPRELLNTLKGPLPIMDLMRLGRLNLRLRGWSSERSLLVRDETTLKFLKSFGFSDEAVERFWRPFLGGIFLESELSTSARMFHFVFSLFARGRATLPREGMQAIPDQLVAGLPTDALYMKSRVVEVTSEGIRLESGEWKEGAQVVDARDPWSEGGAEQGVYGTSCFYVVCDDVPWSAPWLVLCPGQSCINTLTDLSLVHPEYAPAGKHLLSVSCLGIDVGEAEVMSELTDLFGERVRSWQLLERVDVPYALPIQPPGHLNAKGRSGKQTNEVYRCSDVCETASIEGALLSGKRVAEEILVLESRRRG